jgi:predicted acyltransferase (DUF342 family)
MGTGYTRNDTGNNIADGNVINAADFDGEFDAIVSAFATDGHTHDGTAAEGGPIQKLGPSQEVEVDSGAIFPASDGVTDLGKTTKEWKDLYIDGVINTDNISADAATITGNASVGGTFNVGGATTLTGTASLSSAFAVSATSAFKGAVSVESTLRVTGDSDVSNLSASGTLDVAGTTNLATASITGTVNVTGDTTLDNVSANGTLNVSGNGSVGGTFNVEGDLKNSAGNLTVAPTSYILEVKGGGSTEGQIQLNCHVNSHGQIIRSQPHSESVTNEMLLPKGANSTLVSEVGTATITNKTLTSPAINGATIDSAVSVSSAGTLNAGTNSSIVGNVDIGGTLDVQSNGSVGGTFKITGAVTAASTLNIGGAVSGKGTLTVSDTVSAAGAMNVGGNFSGKGTLTVTDAVSVASTLNVGGNFSGKGTFNVAGSATLSGNVTMGDATADTTSVNSQVEFKNNLRERTSISTTSATGVINFDILSHNVELRTNDAAANFELNLRGDSSTAFSATIAVGQTTSVAFESSMGSTAYYLTAIKIDGATASPVHWQGGTTAPSEGNADGIDSYLINVTRSADAGSGTAQYTCLASQTQYGKVTY